MAGHTGGITVGSEKPTSRESGTAGTVTGGHDAGVAGIDAVFALIYDELRVMARQQFLGEQRGHTLQPTALVHEVYLKLARRKGISDKRRTEVLAIAGRAMRQVLIDHARRRRAAKRGGGGLQVALDNALGLTEGSPVDFSHITEALSKLAALDKRVAAIVELRIFGGLTNAEAAETLGVSRTTVERDWRIARAWLRRELRTDT